MLAPRLAFLTMIAALSLSFASVEASARSNDVSMTISMAAAPAAPRLRVTGERGAYTRLVPGKLLLPLKLDAVAVSGSRILATEIALDGDTKSASADAETAVKGAEAVEKLAADRTFSVAVAADGAVAQRAVAACNGVDPADRSADQQVTLNVPAVWRVTSGRFTFRWTNYDRVPPSEAILANPDFYGDRKTHESEIDVAAIVECVALSNAIAGQQPTKSKRHQEIAAPVTAKRVADANVAAEVLPATSRVVTASLPEGSKPVCTDGMLRQSGSAADDYVCLCPGHTMRVETSENAFRCARKYRHR